MENLDVQDRQNNTRGRERFRRFRFAMAIAVIHAVLNSVCVIALKNVDSVEQFHANPLSKVLFVIVALDFVTIKPVAMLFNVYGIALNNWFAEVSLNVVGSAQWFLISYYLYGLYTRLRNRFGRRSL